MHFCEQHHFSRLTPKLHIIQQKLWLLNKTALHPRQAVSQIVLPEAQRLQGSMTGSMTDRQLKPW